MALSENKLSKNDQSGSYFQIDGQLLREPERRFIGETEYYNSSGMNLEQLLSWFPRELKAKRIILLPDISPGDAQHNRLPTGCCVEMDIQTQPEWRKFVLSDVGCGMSVVRTCLSWEQFDANPSLLDKAATTLSKMKNYPGVLGSGNHFIDAVVNAHDPHETVYFVIHSGSGDDSDKATDLVDQPTKFDAAYYSSVAFARQNRNAIQNTLSQTYGPLRLVCDTAHNFFIVQGKTAIIYKGAVRLAPEQLSIIPSSLTGDMVLVRGNELKALPNYAMAHGTGRSISRSESRQRRDELNMQEIVEQLMLPQVLLSKIDKLVTEHPSNYRSIDALLALIGKNVEIENRFTPIAYIGQL